MKISVTDCSCKKLVSVARKCGFKIFEGKNHTKVKTVQGKFITTIPRHNRLKKELVRTIIKSFKLAGCEII